jgi:hypothetical protein
MAATGASHKTGHCKKSIVDRYSGKPDNAYFLAPCNLVRNLKDIQGIISTRSSEKGKPGESRRRKANGSTVAKFVTMIAGPPNNIADCQSNNLFRWSWHILSGLSVFTNWKMSKF